MGLFNPAQPYYRQNVIFLAKIMKKKYLYILLVIVVVAGLSYWFTRQGRPAEVISAPSGGGNRMTVNAQIVRPETFSNTINLSGTLEPDEQVQIRSEISGVVRELAFREGAQVQKGQLLIRMDDSELQAQLIQAQSREKLTEDNEKRAKLLLEREAISTQEYDVAYADFESAKAQTALIQAQLAKTRVLAPFSGRIGLRSVSVGEYLTPTVVVANLMSVDRIKILFSIPEKYSGQVRAGHPIRFTSSNLDREYEGEVFAIEPGVDETTRTIQIRAIANNPGGELVPGAFARIVLPLDRLEDAILIPTYAVIPVQNGKQVFVYKNGTAVAVPVETESRTTNDVLVTDGLVPGDTLITSGIMTIRDGMTLNVQLKESE